MPALTIVLSAVFPRTFRIIRPARLHGRRPARRRRPGEPGARPRRPAVVGPDLPADPRHREPRAGRGPQVRRRLELAIALGLLAAADALPAGALDDVAVLGELGLDGRVRPVVG